MPAQNVDNLETLIARWVASADAVARAMAPTVDALAAKMQETGAALARSRPPRPQ